MKQFLNPDGKTYNGIKALAFISGLSEAEIEWTANRLKQLIVFQNKTKEEARQIIKQECKNKPWLNK